MNISIHELLAIIGELTVEVRLLRAQVEAAQKEIAALKAAVQADG